MGKSQRVKGHSFERLVARTFREFYKDSFRVLEYQENTANGIDVKAGPFNIQCKRHKSYVPINTIKEIKGDDTNKIKLLITKADRDDAMVCLSLSDFIRVLKNENLEMDKE